MDHLSVARPIPFNQYKPFSVRVAAEGNHFIL